MTASAPPDRLGLEFPVLVYPDEGQWVGLSLLTSTVAVAATEDAAFEEVFELLQGEVEDALSEAPFPDALARLQCVAEPQFWMMYFTGSRARTVACTLAPRVQVTRRTVPLPA